MQNENLYSDRGRQSSAIATRNILGTIYMRTSLQGHLSDFAPTLQVGRFNCQTKWRDLWKQQDYPEQTSQQDPCPLATEKSRISVLSAMMTVTLLYIDLVFRQTMAVDRGQRLFRKPTRKLLFLLCCTHPAVVPLGMDGLTLAIVVLLRLLLVRVGAQLIRVRISVLVGWR